MKTIGMLLALCVFATSAFALGEDVDPFEQVKKEAADSGTPILLVFVADWSEQSGALEKDVLGAPSFKRFVRDHFIVFKVDFSRRWQNDEARWSSNKKLSDEYKIHGIPSLVVVDSSGKKVASSPGSLKGGVDAYLAWLGKALKKMGK